MYRPRIVVKISLGSIGTTYDASKGAFDFAETKNLSTAILAILYMFGPRTNRPRPDMRIPIAQKVLDVVSKFRCGHKDLGNILGGIEG